nr:type IV toxin-antitoxin system AbiEi family antitoxin domain-containing protein [Microlunatus antarcticus]
MPYRDFFTRREALELGETDRSLSTALRAGRLVRLRHGVYAFAERLVGLQDEERHLLLARAAVAQQRGAVALAGPTAALQHGFAVFGHDLQVVHLARLDGGSARRETGIVHHRIGAAVSDGITSRNGLLTVSPEDAVWQVALLSSLEGGVVTADSALHQLPALVGPLARVVGRSPFHPHSRTARLALRLARREAESPGESLTRMACYRHGIPAPTLQHKVHDEVGRLLGVSDLYWEGCRLLGEFDGRIKYERLRKEGETATDVVTREKTREDGMRSTGRGMSRFIWSEVQPGSTARRMAKLRQELEQSRRLYVRVAS